MIRVLYGDRVSTTAAPSGKAAINNVQPAVSQRSRSPSGERREKTQRPKAPDQMKTLSEWITLRNKSGGYGQGFAERVFVILGYVWAFYIHANNAVFYIY